MSSLLKRRLAIVLTSSIVAASRAQRAHTVFPWTKGAPFPDPEEELYGAVANPRLYVIGGDSGRAVSEIGLLGLRRPSIRV